MDTNRELWTHKENRRSFIVGNDETGKVTEGFGPFRQDELDGLDPTADFPGRTADVGLLERTKAEYEITAVSKATTPV